MNRPAGRDGRWGRALALGGKVPRCPLCHEWMVKKYEPNRGFFIFACDTTGSCKIACRIDDPFIGRWEEALEKEGGILCPRPGCEAFMRLFATGTGFVKSFCPKCRATLSNAQPDRDKEGGAPIASPDGPRAIPEGPAQ